MYEVKITNFSGPLDLLLKLVEEKNLEITELSLKEVTEDFLRHLQENQNIPLDELADFLVIASTLILIKSKAILPFLKLSQEEEQEVIDLENRLKLYKIFKDLSLNLKAILEKKQILFPRISKSIENLNNTYFFPPKRFSLEELSQVFSNIIKDLEIKEPLPEKRIQKAISLKNRIEQLINSLEDIFKNKDQCEFHEIVKEKNNKLDLILTFLALLHLVKEKIIFLKQEKNFGKIWIIK